MIGIGPTVSIPEEAIGGERVVVRPVRCGGDGQWCLKNGWLEDALWSEEPNPVALQLEALGKRVSRKHVAVGCDHAFEPFEWPPFRASWPRSNTDYSGLLSPPVFM